MRHENFGDLPKKALFFCLIAGLVLFLPSTASFGQSPPKLKAIASLFPLQEFARAVGGEKVEVNLLLPPGAEPHNWEPRPSEAAKIARADIFIYIGRAMEPWVDDLMKAVRNPQLKVVEASQGLPLMEEKDHEHGEKRFLRQDGRGGHIDPHIWLDFSLDGAIVDAIAAAFIAKDPSQAGRYRENAEKFKEKLDTLDRRYRISLSRCRHRQIILGGHSAFAYLAKRYGLQQIALYGVNPNAEPTPKKLTAVIQTTKSHGVRFIYFEGLINPKLAQVLAKEAGVGILALHNGANLTKEQIKNKTTFLSLMETNLVNLQRGLECESQ